MLIVWIIICLFYVEYYLLIMIDDANEQLRDNIYYYQPPIKNIIILDKRYNYLILICISYNIINEQLIYNNKLNFVDNCISIIICFTLQNILFYHFNKLQPNIYYQSTWVHTEFITNANKFNCLFTIFSVISPMILYPIYIHNYIISSLLFYIANY